MSAFTHWTQTAISTYLLHPLRANGYAWWSGAGSDLGELVLIGGAVSLVRHHNCHARGCWRLGRHHVEGTPYKVCRHHHPTIPTRGPSAADIHAAHRDAVKDAVKVREGA